MKDQCPNSYDWKGNDIFFNSLFWLTLRHAQRLSQSKAKYNKLHLDGVGTTIMKLIVVIVNAPIPSLEFVPYAGSMRFFTINKDNYRFGKRNGKNTICK